MNAHPSQVHTCKTNVKQRGNIAFELAIKDHTYYKGFHFTPGTMLFLIYALWQQAINPNTWISFKSLEVTYNSSSMEESALIDR